MIFYIKYKKTINEYIFKLWLNHYKKTNLKFHHKTLIYLTPLKKYLIHRRSQAKLVGPWGPAMWFAWLLFT